MNFTDTMKLSPLAKDLMESETLDGLLEKIELWIKEEEEKDDQSYALPKKKWTIYKTSFFVLIFLLVPACVYIVYALFFLQPRYEAFISSNEAFLNTNSSQVISELEPYNPEQMPRVVQYQLAQSYVANENLNMEQAANVQNTLTLQSAEPYFHYWIAIGRGDNEEANDIAKNFQDEHLIVYANLKWRDEVREDTDLSSEDRDALLTEIERVIDDIWKLWKNGKESQRKRLHSKMIQVMKVIKVKKIQRTTLMSKMKMKMIHLKMMVRKKKTMMMKTKTSRLSGVQR